MEFSMERFFFRSHVFFCIAICLLFTAAAQAEIRETKLMSEALQAVDAETLLVLDIDNTLIEPDQAMGSDQWFDHVFDTLVNHEKLSADAAEAETEEIWGKVQAVTGIHTVEPITAKLIADKQARRYRLMALTARPLDLMETTLTQLKSVHIDFAKNAVRSADLRISGKDVSTNQKSKSNEKAAFRDAHFRHGVLFANGNDKGKLLLAFIHMLGLKPSRIVFVDDKRYNVENVERAFAQSGIPHIEFRYGGADATVKRFDPELADIQYYYLHHILDDGRAATLKANAKGPRPWK